MKKSWWQVSCIRESWKAGASVQLSITRRTATQLEIILSMRFTRNAPWRVFPSEEVRDEIVADSDFGNRDDSDNFEQSTSE